MFEGASQAQPEETTPKEEGGLPDFVNQQIQAAQRNIDNITLFVAGGDRHADDGNRINELREEISVLEEIKDLSVEDLESALSQLQKEVRDAKDQWSEIEYKRRPGDSKAMREGRAAERQWKALEVRLDVYKRILDASTEEAA